MSQLYKNRRSSSMMGKIRNRSLKPSGGSLATAKGVGYDSNHSESNYGAPWTMLNPYHVHNPVSLVYRSKCYKLIVQLGYLRQIKTC